MADQLDDEISADELAALLGQDAAPPPDPLPSRGDGMPRPQAGEGENSPLGDEISADELAALGLASPPGPLPSKAREGESNGNSGGVGAQFIAPNPSPSDHIPPRDNLAPQPEGVRTSEPGGLAPGGHAGQHPAPGGTGEGPNLPQLTAQDDVAADAGISLLMDVPLRVSIELGRISMTLQQVLGLGRGSIIELERLAGEPVDILVNDKLIGRGEVVVIDEYFGVKITELIDPKG